MEDARLWNTLNRKLALIPTHTVFITALLIITSNQDFLHKPQTMTHIENGTSSAHTKHLNPHSMRRHGGTVICILFMKETNLERHHAVWFQPHDIPTTAPCGWTVKSGIAGVGRERERQLGIPRAIKVLHTRLGCHCTSSQTHNKYAWRKSWHELKTKKYHVGSSFSINVLRYWMIQTVGEAWRSYRCVWHPCSLESIFLRS